MNLFEAISEVQDKSEDDVIFAKKPFTVESDSLISKLDHDLGIPEEITSQGYSYFLEQFLVKELIEDAADLKISKEKHVELVLFYGIHDAYPEWYYQYNSGNQTNA